MLKIKRLKSKFPLQEPEPVKVLKQLEIINGEERQTYKVIEIKPK